MHLHTRNVNTAFKTLAQTLSSGEYGGDFDGRIHGDKVPVTKRASRNGNVLMIDEPVTVTYTHPRERVLFNAARDANPFFHLYEALWMLAGRNDVGSVAYYAKQMREYSDDGVTLNGAYGYRWRQAHSTECTIHPSGTINPKTGRNLVATFDKVDQLDLLVNHLRTEPTSRRAVLQMWNVGDDLLKIGHREYNGRKPKPHHLASKDVCCLSGDTKFRSPEGDKSIEKLAKKFHTEPGYRYPIYTIDPITGDQRLSWMTAAWKTGIKKTILVKLDDGSSVRLTPNHVVYRKKKTFEGKRCTGVAVIECEAGDLRVGDSLLSELPEDSVSRVNQGYRHFKRNVFKNTGGSNMVKEHRDYYEFATGNHPGTNDVHHVNENRLDNRLDNLKSLSELEHQRLHKTGASNPHCKMSSEDKKKRGRIHSAVLRSGGKQYTPEHVREILNVRPPHRTDEQNEVLWDWVCSLSNHKVVEIEDAGYTTVYDFTVPGRHNAVLSNGVLVHNCNLSVMFSLREETPTTISQGDPTPDNKEHTIRRLDMTVTNRSNDLVWGMLGANYCLAADTKLASPEGNITVKDLADKFNSGELSRYPVYSFDTRTKDFRLSWCTGTWKTGRKKVLEIGWDDGTTSKMTADHRLFCKKRNSGKFCEEVQAGKLRVGDRVWAGKLWATASGRKQIPKRLGVSTSGGNVENVARAYWEFVNGPLPEGYIVHHRDEDKTNDRITNLEAMTRGRHGRHHITEAHPMHAPGANTKQRVSRRRFFDTMTPEQRKKWSDDRKKKTSNHVVVSIREAGTEDVYDFTVPGDHNAMLDNGVMVHNCHFTFLQEYMASRLGAEVGRYHHFTNNLHAYEWNWKPKEWMAEYENDKYNPDGYINCGKVLIPLVKDPEAFEWELPKILQQFDGDMNIETPTNEYTEPFLRDVVHPALYAFNFHKRHDTEMALLVAGKILADDWRIACTAWFRRRVK